MGSKVCAQAAACLCLILLTARLDAAGAYVLAGFGVREITNQDLSDFFAQGSQPGPKLGPSFVSDATLTGGYRILDPLALELALGTQLGREESNLYSFGDVDVQVPDASLVTLAIAPVYCFDTRGGPESQWLHQVGLRLLCAQVSGTETLQSYGGGFSSLQFSGTGLGWGLFYRLMNLWAPSRINMGAEIGYESLRFTGLTAAGASGGFAGQSGGPWLNLNSAAAFLDDSGPYLRLEVGWSQAPKR
jgi:hypothetical protein